MFVCLFWSLVAGGEGEGDVVVGRWVHAQWEGVSIYVYALAWWFGERERERANHHDHYIIHTYLPRAVPVRSFVSGINFSTIAAAITW